MALTTEFTKQFNIDYPIVIAPMFLVNTVPLVIAAAEAGVMGTFPALNFRPVENYASKIKDIKSKTDKSFGINIIVQKTNKYKDEQIDIALELGVDLLITSLGNPKEAIKRAHSAGKKVYCDVVGLEHAKKVADLGADGVIAVSYGAGGHAGTLSPFALIPDLIKHLSIPVLAAGAISNGRGMAAAFSLGASGIYMGTRFIASKEADVDNSFKQAIINARPEDIINTDKVDGFAGNFIKTKELEAIGIDKGIFELLVSKSKKFKRMISLARAAKSLLGDPKGKSSYKTIFSAGQGVGDIENIETVENIVQSIIKEYQDIKSTLP